MYRKSGTKKEASLLRDAVFASTDGIITTFAIVAGSLGAGLEHKIVVILGAANLFADGLSMAAGIFLGTRSESELENKIKYVRWQQATPITQGIVTFTSFVVAGFFPLIPYVFSLNSPVATSIFFVAGSLFLVGILKAFVVGKSILKGVFEMLTIGGLALVAAYLVGDIAEKILSNI